MTRLTRSLGLGPLALLTACASQPSGTLLVQQQEDCPLRLTRDQVLVLTLPSDPTSGFRWEVREGAVNVLRSLGPEVYAAGEDDEGLVDGGGHSTWRFKATEAGEGHLMLISRRPWETGVAPADMFDCRVEVQP